ncbi:MAG: hypothetical protein K9J80_16965 [Sulfuritalea sp.]|nr:hypothetical protein [Sulfuritalea sp.]
MLKSYEALLDHGQIRWLESPPDLDMARIIVTVLPSAHTDQAVTRAHPVEQVDQLLSRTTGAWGKRPASEVRTLLAKQRQADWGDD